MKTTNKLLRTALFSAMAVAGSAAISAANAGEIHYDQYPDGIKDTDPITIACEAFDEVQGIAYDLDPGVLSPLGNPTGATFMYISRPGSLSTANLLKIYLENGSLDPATGNCKLLIDEDNAIDGDGDGNPDPGTAGEFDVNNDGDTNDLLVAAYTPAPVGGASEINLVVNQNGQVLPNNAVLYLACEWGTDPQIEDYDDDADASTVGEDRDFDPMYNPVINIATPTVNDKVCIRVEGYAEVAGVPQHIPNLDAATNCFIDYECQFALSIHPTLQIIDEYWPSNGRHFVDDLLGPIIYTDSEVELDAADGNINIENDPDETVEDYIHLHDDPDADIDGAAIFDVAIYTDDGYACNNDGAAAYSALDFDNDRMYLDGDGVNTTDGPNFLFTPGDGNVPGSACTLSLVVTDDGSGDIDVPHGSVWQDDVYMGVDGDHRMNFVRWDLDEALTVLGDTHMLSSNDLPEGFFKKWEPNGTTLWAPLLNKYNVVVKISHNNPNKITQVPASNIPTTHDIIEVRAKVWDADEEWCDNILVGTFTDQGILTMTGKQIWNAAKAQCPSVDLNGQFSALFTVGAPERDIEAAVIQDSSKGSRSLPIYQSNWRTDDLRLAPDSLDLHRE